MNKRKSSAYIPRNELHDEFNRKISAYNTFAGQKDLLARTENLEKGQLELISRTGNLEKGQKELISRTENLEKGQDLLTAGQNEIKELIKQTATLMTENFTYIREDMKSLALDVNSDIELLFKEMADVKRKVNKLEQK
ncbi:hypothetical protein ABC255_16740 [Neobacillus sp. 3P2-tot-E-2]|uniref:hypothetical protein n=1 Tax=Neobacillus sp. 3P2-tot-E-2 TaxID=3132212 RepID=UPI0039A0C5BF